MRLLNIMTGSITYPFAQMMVFELMHYTSKCPATHRVCLFRSNDTTLTLSQRGKTGIAYLRAVLLCIKLKNKFNFAMHLRI